MTITLTDARHDLPSELPARRADVGPERRRVSLPNRIALRLGLLLIAWGRRSHRSRERLHELHRNERSRERREQQAQRMLYLVGPPR